MAAYVEDTIAALATPPGVGAVAVIRISGRGAREVASRVLRRRRSEAALLDGAPSHQARIGILHRPGDPAPIDEVLALQMLAPRSFTGEDVVEIHCHGGRLVPDRALRAVLAGGARAARAGEFTERAFLNGRLDLCQAEAVADMIEAATDVGLAAAWQQLDGALSRAIMALRDEVLDARAEVEAHLDFPEDDLPTDARARVEGALERVARRLGQLAGSYERGRLGREGVRVVLLGKPNVGKSSLLNALIGRERALVSPEAGTTRDYLEEPAAIAGLSALVYDTAGIRDADSHIEAAGIARSGDLAVAADVLLCVLDTSMALDQLDNAVLRLAQRSRKPSVLVGNKRDLAQAWSPGDLDALWGADDHRAAPPFAPVSAASGEGLEALCTAIATQAGCGSGEHSEPPLVTRARQHSAILDASQQVRSAANALRDGGPLDAVATELQMAACGLDACDQRARLDRATGPCRDLS